MNVSFATTKTRDTQTLTTQPMHHPFRPFIQPRRPLLPLLFLRERAILDHARQRIHDCHGVDVLWCTAARGFVVAGLVPVFQGGDGVGGCFGGRGDCGVL